MVVVKAQQVMLSILLPTAMLLVMGVMRMIELLILSLGDKYPNLYAQGTNMMMLTLIVMPLYS
jgi:hypothetical protein